MRFTVRQDIAAPIAEVFAAATDHEGWERQALRRGAEVRRADPPAPSADGPAALQGAAPGASRSARLAPGTTWPGTTWSVAFPFRGRERRATIRLEQMQPPSRIEALTEGGGFSARSVVDLLALSRGTTRLTLALDVQARTMTARLLLQGVKLARGRVQQRLAERLAAWARDLEARSRRPGDGGPRGTSPGGPRRAG